MKTIRTIGKILSANDVGTTDSHQAGILIPKDPQLLGFFPTLNSEEKNPRVSLIFNEHNGNTHWKFEFIYYNNRQFGGTRNEYRLTCMTRYLRSKNAKVGDEVVFMKNESGDIFVDCRRETEVEVVDGVLKLAGGWKIISIK